VPVAAMNAEGSMESLDGPGWTLTPDNIPEAAQIVGDILDHKHKRERVTAMARQSACRRFDFSRTADDTIKVYKAVLDASESDFGSCLQN